MLRADNRETSRQYVAPFFNPLPAGAKAKFLIAVGLVFAPLMLLTNSSLSARSWGTMLFWCAVSGGIAVLWAASYIISKRLLVPAILLNVLAVLSIASRWPALLQPEASRPSVFGVLAALLVAGGYVFFVMFVSGEGARVLRLHTELRLARQIHGSLVPPLAFRNGAIEVYGRSDASSEMGGDLIDLVVGARSVDLYLADVSGHGVRAGVLMAMVKSALRTTLLGDSASRDSAACREVGQVVGDLNRVVAQVKEQDMFVTLACARFELDGIPTSSASGQTSHPLVRVRCALAGHLPILYWRAVTRTLAAVDNDSLPLGVADDERFEPRVLECAPGDLLVLYTDGLTECTDPAGNEFGLERFRSLVASVADRPLPELFDAVITSVRAHGPQVDDQTLLLARIA